MTNNLSNPHVRADNENNLIGEEKNERYVETPEEMHPLKGEIITMHLTQDDYEDSLNTR
jgi:hypothetical protein